MPPERASFEFTKFDEEGIEVSYDRQTKRLIFQGWFNYIQWMEDFDIPLEEFLKSLAIPIEDIRSAYDLDCWGKKRKTPGNKKKPRYKSNYVRKTPVLFKYRKKEDKPKYDLVCQWQECGKTFVSIDKKRKYCCMECVQKHFVWYNKSGLREEKVKKRIEINKKISETMLKRKKKNEL